MAQDRGLPVSTVARQLLLQSLAPTYDLKSALDRLEQDISACGGRRSAPDSSGLWTHWLVTDPGCGTEIGFALP